MEKLTFKGDEDNNEMRPINKDVQLRESTTQIRSMFPKTHLPSIITTTTYGSPMNLNCLFEFFSCWDNPKTHSTNGIRPALIHATYLNGTFENYNTDI